MPAPAPGRGALIVDGNRLDARPGARPPRPLDGNPAGHGPSPRMAPTAAGGLSVAFGAPI